ncbi:MAG: hypothetical protein IKU29_02415 [Parabacteroides sp.]|nr:hypothetical protein [Parabacteroides sp.]
MNLISKLQFCPIGTKFYSTLHGDIYFLRIESNHIVCSSNALSSSANEYYFTSRGSLANYPECECIIFPSKTCREWGKVNYNDYPEGSFLYVKTKASKNEYLFIKANYTTPIEYITKYKCHVIKKRYGWGDLCVRGLRSFDSYAITLDEGIQEIREMNDDEKEIMLSILAEHGYKYDFTDRVIKTIECGKFKVGQYIKSKTSSESFVIESITNNGYKFEDHPGIYSFTEIDNNYELDQFTVDHFKPFMKVLGWNEFERIWVCDFYSHYDDMGVYRFQCIGDGYKKIIPYNNSTKSLLKTDLDAPDYYKDL